MPVDQLGSEQYPKLFKYSGQKVYEFKDYYIFVLRNHVYRTAGKKHWPSQVKSGSLSAQGISLNQKLFGKAVSCIDKPFLVYDKKRSRLFRLEDRRLISNTRGTEKRGDKKLIVLPLDAFKQVSLEKVPKRLR